jgi:hypothetical protein
VMTIGICLATVGGAEGGGPDGGDAGPGARTATTKSVIETATSVIMTTHDQNVVHHAALRRRSHSSRDESQSSLPTTFL